MRDKIKQVERIVIKIGTSSITYQNGKLNLRKIEQLVRAVSVISRQQKEVILVSSGAVGVGAGRIGLHTKPEKLSEKQALAAIGQAELIKIYRNFFDNYDKKIAQVLLTMGNLNSPVRLSNATNTMNSLLKLGIIPIINENDAVSTQALEIGDNDSLSAHIAIVAESDLLIILSDIDNLYTDDPRSNPNAKPIKIVKKIDKSIEDLARGAGSSFGTGGMATKIKAAKMCMEKGINTVIASAEDPNVLEYIINGKEVGTLFYCE